MAMTVIPTVTPEQQLLECVLQCVWRAHTHGCSIANDLMLKFMEDFFRIDESLPAMVLEHAPKLGFTPEQTRAAIGCWRDNQVQAVDMVAARYMTVARNGSHAGSSIP